MSRNKIYAITLKDGTTQEYSLMAVYKAGNGRLYAALRPHGPNAPNALRVSIYRAEPAPAEADGYKFFSIASKAEFAAAREAFEQLKAQHAKKRAAGPPAKAIESVPPPAGGKQPGAPHVGGRNTVLSFRDETGRLQDWQLIDTFNVNKRGYIALLRHGASLANGADIHLFRMARTVRNGVEGIEVANIPSDMEYDAAAMEFERRVAAGAGS